jgi:Na+-transporting NADH:ubiquinone oxidoreductase subunit B
MGETSALACLIGAVILILTGVGSWRTMFGVTLGTFATAALLNAIGSTDQLAVRPPPLWHFVLGGWAFGMVFMATDPVSSAFTAWGKVLYGFGIGVMVVLVRVINPAYPEGMMLAILFMNMFAPLIDYFIVKANITRRSALYGTR